MNVEFAINEENIERAARAMFTLKKIKAADFYRQFYQRIRQQTYKRYLQAARETKFAPGSIGRKKPHSGRKIPDGYFGIDSGELFYQLVNNVRFEGFGFVIPTSLDYAEFVLRKFEEKGPFAPSSPIFIDDDDLAFLEGLIGNRIIENFS